MQESWSDKFVDSFPEGYFGDDIDWVIESFEDFESQIAEQAHFQGREQGKLEALRLVEEIEPTMIIGGGLKIENLVSKEDVFNKLQGI